MKIGWAALRTSVLLSLLLTVTPIFTQFDPVVEHRLFDQANEERTKLGLNPFVWDDRLMHAARTHAEKMAEAHSLSHRVANEADLSDRIAATGLRFSMVAENIAYATQNPNDLHNDWMHSPGHRANILNPKADTLGVAVLKYKNTFYAVEDFAKFVMEDSNEKAEKRLAATFNRLRVEAKQRVVPIDYDQSLRTIACSMAEKDAPEARRIPARDGARGSIAFNTTQPEDLPQQLTALARDPLMERMSVGGCFKATPKNPGGAYWFAIVY